MTPKIKYLLAALSIVAGFVVMRVGFLLKNSLTSATANTEITSEVLSESTPKENALTIDTDHDGVVDRDEVIYATDFENPDTDGDGFLDGEEITSGHDALDASSNSNTSPDSKEVSKGPNLTDRMSNLTVAFMMGDDGNFADPRNIDPETVSKISQDLQTAAALALFVEPVNEADLNVSEDNSPEAVRKYLDTVSPVIEQNLISPMSVAGRGNFGTTLDNFVDYYQDAYQTLFLTEVPSSWKEIHKSVLNNFQLIIKASAHLDDATISNDPVKSMFALQQLQGAFFNFKALLSQAATQVKKQNVLTNNTILEALQN